MTSNLIRLLFVPVWIAGLWGSLQIHRYDLNLGHSVCGSWGCGPPIEALIGYHGFWTLIILPIAAGVGAFVPAAISRKVGWAVLGISVLGTVGYVAWDVISYAMRSGDYHVLMQRGLFTLITTVDIPMLPTILAGGILTFWFGRERVAAPSSDDGLNSVAASESISNANSDSGDANPFAPVQ